MTRSELNAILDELCIGPDDNVVFLEILGIRLESGAIYNSNYFYEPIAYEGGFVVIKEISPSEVEKPK